MTKHVFLINSKSFELKQGNQIIGRSSENQISLGEPSLSSKHLLISNLGKSVEVTDLNSSNGTLINNSRLNPFSPVKLNSGDKIKLGKLEVIYNSESLTKSTASLPNPLQNKAFLDEKFKDMRGDVTVLATFDPKQFTVEAQKDEEEDDVVSLQEANKRLAFLYSFGQKIGSIIDIKDFFKNILKEIFEIFSSADRAMVFIEKDGEMNLEIFMKDGQEYPISMAKYSKTIVNLATEEKKAFVASDLGHDENFDTSKSILMLNLQCSMIVPFVVDNELFGLLQLDSTKKVNAFTEEDLQMLSGLCNQIAINIKNKQLIDEMHQQEKIRGSLEIYLGPKMVTHLIEKSINLEQEGEERLVSILFSDIRGFTPLSERLKPKQIIEILTIYFSKMTEIIFKYDGFIDKFIGDAIFCIFGIPLFQDNHADLAVQAAVEMQRELVKINNEIFKPMDVELNIGIGINTGNVVYGNIASMERPEVTVLGDSVNTSERLCSLAKPGQILTANNSLSYLKDDYTMEKIGLLSLKGKLEKVLVHSIKY